jgi:hypothetical protein
MAQVTIKYDARNSLANTIINFIKSFDFFTIEEKEEIPYNKEFVKKIDRAIKQKSTGKVIATEDLGK